ncbi:FxsA family protein [Kushneria sp. Sum13]|uniref:FxsA family protein n=1 Tax=Kushneria sp. Sum13 TaxID=3459196 RepID=UPI0040467F62
MPLLLPIGFFLLLDLISIFVLGKLIGAWVLLVIVLAAAFGIHLIRREGVDSFRQAQQKMATGGEASAELKRGAALIMAGVLLVMPGILTDAIAVFCLMPFSRSALLGRFMRSNVNVHRYHPDRDRQGDTYTQPERDTSANSSSNPRVIEGEIVDSEKDHRK